MAEKTSQGQADKAEAERRTAEVGAENRQPERQQGTEEPAAEPSTAAKKVEQATSDDDTVLVNPYPPYEEQSLGQLRSVAGGRNVEINRDVEKAHLVHKLRATDPTPAWDLMSLEQVRERARGMNITLNEEFEQAHLITELRAADTHTR